MPENFMLRAAKNSERKHRREVIFSWITIAILTVVFLSSLLTLPVYWDTDRGGDRVTITIFWFFFLMLSLSRLRVERAMLKSVRAVVAREEEHERKQADR